MSNNEKANNKNFEHSDYRPSGLLEKGYQPTANFSQLSPSSLPTTGSSVTAPISDSNTDSSTSCNKNEG